MNPDRKTLLTKLIETRFNGNQAALGRAIKKSPGQVNQWLTGYRSIGDGVARHIELSLGLGNGWMDGKDQQPVGVRSDVALLPEAIFTEAAKLLASMEPHHANVWITKLKCSADVQREETRAAQEDARQQQEQSIQRADKPPGEYSQKERRRISN